MSRIQQIDPVSATGKSKQLLDPVQSRLGIVPNLTPRRQSNKQNKFCN